MLPVEDYKRVIGCDDTVEDLWEMKEDIAQVSAFLINGKGNPNRGNDLIVMGSIGRWDGASGGFAVAGTLEEAIDGMGRDVEVRRVTDVNGRLLVEGAHHDGYASIEVMQATGAGQRVIDEMSLDGGHYVLDEGIELFGETYRDCPAGEVLGRMFNEAAEGHGTYAERPRVMERLYGCPEEQYEVKVPESRDVVRISTAGPSARGEGYQWDVQLWRHDPYRGQLVYTGNGRFCRDLEEAIEVAQAIAGTVGSTAVGDSENVTDRGEIAPTYVRQAELLEEQEGRFEVGLSLRDYERLWPDQEQKRATWRRPETDDGMEPGL